MKKRKVKSTSRFCVINCNTPNQGRRTVLSTEAKALEHARNLMDADWNTGRNPAMYVVEIRKVVTKGRVPISVSSPLKLEVSE